MQIDFTDFRIRASCRPKSWVEDNIFHPGQTIEALAFFKRLVTGKKKYLNSGSNIFSVNKAGISPALFNPESKSVFGQVCRMGSEGHLVTEGFLSGESK
jgi:hypothetical protein